MAYVLLANDLLKKVAVKGLYVGEEFTGKYLDRYAVGEQKVSRILVLRIIRGTF